jgi:hypothetical protein
MRPSPLARRWLDARHLVTGLSLVVIALALLAYWAWQESVRRHQVAIELLRSHAELAAQRLGARMQNELYLSATAAFRPALAAARSSGTGSFDPNTLLAAAREAEACNCVPPLRPAYALRTDLTTAGTVFAGPASPTHSERESLLAALRDELATMPNGWDIAVLEDGPCVIEGNRGPDIDIHQRTCRGPIGNGRFGELLAFNLESRTGLG